MSEKDASHEARLKELRERLYSRGQPPVPRERRELRDQPIAVAHSWDGVLPPSPDQPIAVVEPDAPHAPLLAMKHPSRTYRVKLIVGGLIFFVVALLLSGSFLLFGKNMISGDNISVDVQAPFVVGGGEELDLQVTLANRNAVPVESATLIVEYPFGTQSAEDEGKELFRERKPLAPLNPGEVVNIPLRARVFGEENEEKTVLVSIEYRVSGSNAIFYKQAEPIRFKISSSPIVLFVENIEKVSSGQDAVLEVSVTSNSPSDVADVLLKAEYPQGFDFTEAKPSPVSGQDTWNIGTLKPQEQKKVTIRGALLGKQGEGKVFRFSVGVPNERDRFTLASVFSTQKEEMTIEDPFLDVGIDVNGSTDENPVVAPGQTANVTVRFKNTLSTTLYEGKIVVDLSGNSLNESQVRSTEGFYDSSSNTLTWDQHSASSLGTIEPGGVRTFMFSISSLGEGGSARTPQVSVKVAVEGNRVSEGNAEERLKGSASRMIKLESVAQLKSHMLYSTGAFTNTGPVPPEAEKVTTYTMHLSLTNGTNAVTDGVVTMKLPVYVAWLDLTTSQPNFSYNPQTREVSWKVGDLDAGTSREADFQISFKPSVSQVGQVVTLVEGQYFRALDRFTGTTIRGNAPAVTTHLMADPAHSQEDGRVASGQ